MANTIQQQLDDLVPQFIYWEKTKDLIDQLLDIVLNYRQSGHPGGSRSKVHILVAALLSGAMRWDIRRPEERFADRFVLGAGHTVPLIYCALAVYNEALRIKHRQTGDPRYAIAGDAGRTLYWEDLLGFRRRGGLSGHAEMAGKTLFLKFNTGPSGHGGPAAAGEALALKRAGADGVKVFFLEGEGGLTPGGVFETMNSAWGLALDNLCYLIDWNDFGIDDHPVSAAVPGTPADWFARHGWRVLGTEQGMEWRPVTEAILELTYGENPDRRPGAAWFKTRKGRGYLKYDNPVHGVPHKINSEIFWETKRLFAKQYGMQFVNFGGPAPADPVALQAEFRANLEMVIDVLHHDQALVDYLADRLVELGESVPEEIPGFKLKAITGGTTNKLSERSRGMLPSTGSGEVSRQAQDARPTGRGDAKAASPFEDERLYDFRSYPADLFIAPGTMAANRAAFARWGAWANAFGAREYGRPLFLVASADLSGSTNISGFAERYGDFPGYGWYERFGSPDGVLLPQEITEFANAGILVGMATVNFSHDPEHVFDGFWGACSTYGSFSYLKYGPMRLFSQLAQDCELKVGKMIWVAGHSGPETAEDSRTHFGIYAPGVTQLFPDGAIINLHPWEYNEVPVLLGAALREKAPIVALHLTRPPVEIPDRAALGIPSHFEAARGAYVLRAYKPGPRGGTVIIQGASAVANVVKALPALDERGLNVKLVCATSPQLFALQPEAYRRSVLAPSDYADSTVITTQARWLMHDWLFNKVAEAYALSADWDNRWRTGGAVDEVLDEAHLTPEWIVKGIERFSSRRIERLACLQAELDDARSA